MRAGRLVVLMSVACVGCVSPPPPWVPTEDHGRGEVGDAAGVGEGLESDGAARLEAGYDLGANDGGDGAMPVDVSDGTGWGDDRGTEGVVDALAEAEVRVDGHADAGGDGEPGMVDVPDGADAGEDDSEDAAEELDMAGDAMGDAVADGVGDAGGDADAECKPLCIGTECGGDGCGGQCGPGCGSDEWCLLGTCACTFVKCGDNCCPAGQACNELQGVCCSKTLCGPGGIECGQADDGCGGVLECEECQKGNACEGLVSCEGNKCVKGEQLDCDDGSECTFDSCNKFIGECEHAYVKSGTPCKAEGICEGQCLNGECLEYGVETCDLEDNDCDGDIDEPGAINCQNYFADEDGDGFGDPGKKLCVCQPTVPYVTKDYGDCDDGDPYVSPAALEVCNKGKDDNCDKVSDPEGAPGCQTWYVDSDGDGWGSSLASKCLCGASGPYVTLLPGDCNDDKGEVNPAAVEGCNGQDDDCDAKTDEDVVDCGAGFACKNGQCVCTPESCLDPKVCIDGACKDLGLKWVLFSGGPYAMGCSPGDAECSSDEKPSHQVTVAKFEMMEAEVTEAQYEAVMKGKTVQGSVVDETPSCDMNGGGGASSPVECVTWYEAKAFCEALEGRLPTEAEWEYAARGGTATKYPCGDDSACLDGIAWYTPNSDDGGGPHKHDVKGKAPNGCGMYDMLGNVWEWVEDCWHGSYDGAPGQGYPAWSENCSGSLRVLRGGGFYNGYDDLRVSSRYGCDGPPCDAGGSRGFRCARSK